MSGRVELVHAPLVETTIRDSKYAWYDLAEVQLSEPAQLMFIDGPPKTSGSLARYPALPMLYDHLDVGGVLLMDDASRPDETEAVERWKVEYPELSVTVHRDTKGTVEVIKGTR